MKVAGRRSHRKPENWIRIAKERISILISLAEKEKNGHPERSRRYVELARKIGMRYNVRLGKENKRKFCSECNAFFVHGKNCMVRTVKEKQSVVFRCLGCGHEQAYPYVREKRENKNIKKEK